MDLVEDPVPYQVLGLPFIAVPSQISEAFRRLTLVYHPDKNKGALSLESLLPSMVLWEQGRTDVHPSFGSSFLQE